MITAVSSHCHFHVQYLPTSALKQFTFKVWVQVPLTKINEEFSADKYGLITFIYSVIGLT